MHLDDILINFGLKREDLTPAEVDTLRGWADSLNRNTLTLLDVKNNIEAMTEGIERELAEPPKDIVSWLFRRKRQAHLMARLQNYLLLRDFLTKPERAKKFVEEQLKRVAPKTQ